jgi:hypothetical protein
VSTDAIMLVIITEINVVCWLLNLRMSYKAMRAAQANLKCTQKWAKINETLTDTMLKALADIERRVSILEDEAFK